MLFDALNKTLKSPFSILLAAWGMDQEIPDYDMDSEDEQWMNKQARKMEITPLQFENMMDRLEKGSGQQVLSFIICSSCSGQQVYCRTHI